ncbi:MAG: aminopeptidase P family protein [Bdellovibrionales bacterium]
MRKPLENVKHFKKRRDRALEILGSNALILMAHPEQSRWNYRQDSNMYYLTGFEEPESILMLLPGKKPSEVLFVRRKNPERETWDGFRYGPEGAKTEFQFEFVYPIDEFQDRALEFLKGYEGVYLQLNKEAATDAKMLSLLGQVKASQSRTGIGHMSIHDAASFLGEMRVVKSEEEIINIRTACEISAQAHSSVMKQIKPGMSERQVQAILAYEFLNRGAAREGYNYIVASGNNATTLHYNFNDQICKDGDLLLVDAGAEYNYYTGDITRTFPVNGKFTRAQHEVYSRVLEVQLKLIAMVKPGVPFKAFHETAAELLTEAMLDLGLLSGRKSDIIAGQIYKKYYPHGVGHYLGLDVHDSGKYFIKDQPRPIEAGMCFTIEPGLYIPAHDSNAPAEFRGIGVRIEDNILVTPNGCEVMTKSASK